MTYDAWKTACPPEGRTLEVTLNVVVRITVDNDPDLDIDREAVHVMSAIEAIIACATEDHGLSIEEIDATVIEREIIK